MSWASTSSFIEEAKTSMAGTKPGHDGKEHRASRTIRPWLCGHGSILPMLWGGQAGRGEQTVCVDSTQSNHPLDRMRPEGGFDDMQMNPAAPCASERPVFGSRPSR